MVRAVKSPTALSFRLGLSEQRIRLPLRIAASLKAKLAVLAEREHRSLNKQIEFPFTSLVVAAIAEVYSFDRVCIIRKETACRAYDIWSHSLYFTSVGLSVTCQAAKAHTLSRQQPQFGAGADMVSPIAESDFSDSTIPSCSSLSLPSKAK